MTPAPHAILLLAALLLLASPIVALAWLLDCVFGNHRRPY